MLGDIDRLDELVDEAGATHVVVAHSRPRRHLRSRLAQLASDRVSIHWVALGGGGAPDLADLGPASEGGAKEVALDRRQNGGTLPVEDAGDHRGGLAASGWSDVDDGAAVTAPARAR